MNYRTTLYMTCVFLCLLFPECYSREAMATTTSGIKDSGVFVTETSYYTRASCIKESGQAVMANGKELNDNEYLCASWDFRFGVLLRVTDCRSGRSVIVKVCDRGPAKRLYKKGRRLDISLAAFKALSGGRLDRGLLQVEVSRER